LQRETHYFTCPRHAARYMYKCMATKKPVKAKVKASVKAKVKTKAIEKKLVKSVKKTPPKKATFKLIDRLKAVAKPVLKLVAKTNTKTALKAEIKPEKTRVEKAAIDSGGTLLEMAKEEMSKINAPMIEAMEKAEKSGKFKPIKVERGNLDDEKEKWQELFKRYGKEKAVSYKMSDEFQALKPINHKILGWGFILTNENNRLEVLFENGIKVLISNYK